MTRYLHYQLLLWRDLTNTCLENDGAFKDHQHEGSEQRIVPILVQAPERDAEHLEDKKGRHGMLSEKFSKFGDGDMALVETVGRLQSLEIRQTSFRGGRLGLCGRVREDTAGSLEDREGRGRVAGVGDRREDIVGAYSASSACAVCMEKGGLRL